MRCFLLLIALTVVTPIVPAFALATTGQEDLASQTVTVTGVIEKPEITTYMYGTHSITEEASDTLYALRSEEEGLLDDHTGSRVTIYGVSVPEYEDGAIEGGPSLLDVVRVEPGVDLNEDGVVDEADGDLATRVSDDAASREADEPTLPVTGGLPVSLLGAILLLLTVGLPAYYAVWRNTPLANTVRVKQNIHLDCQRQRVPLAPRSARHL